MKAPSAILLPISLSVAAGLAHAADTTPCPVSYAAASDTYHGVKIIDHYRWLETSADQAATIWVNKQSQQARAVLDALPFRTQLRARATEVVMAPQASFGGLQEEGGRLFALRKLPPRERPTLVLLPSLDAPDSAKLIVDPLTLDPSGNTTIDFYEASRDGKKVAVSLSQKGTEAGDIHVYEVDTGKEILPVVPRAHTGTAGGTLAWNGDGSGFLYTRHPWPGERAPADQDLYQQVYFHKLGDAPKSDTYQLGKELPRIAESFLDTTRDGKYAIDLVQKGDGGEFALYIGELSTGKWTQLADYADELKSAQIGPDGNIYLLSLRDAPRGKILRLSPKAKLDQATVVVPQGEGVISGFRPARTLIYVTTLLGGPTRLDAYALTVSAHPARPIPILPVSSAFLGPRLGDGDDILFMNMSYVEIGGWYRYSAQSGAVSETQLRKKSVIDTSQIEVVRENATSNDGTAIPMNIVRKKGTPNNGQNPTLLTGYGGFGLSRSPAYSAANLLLVEQGFVVVEANLRGGGEFGEAWHHAGRLTHKQNVFDDFYACAKTLVDRRYTNAKKLAILGGSNGGLLMGAALTQHPEAYAAVVAHVGIYDMVRYETDPNGSFNTTEYGSVKDAAQFSAIHAYSPFHHVKDGVHYPPTLFTTGLNDPRVKSYHSFKMTARLQDADPTGEFLLRTSANSGHGTEKLTDTIELLTDQTAFLLQHLGVAYTPIKSVNQARR
jgi:prolyl oligopeptidase